jgi:hypothetical protein
MILHFEAGDMYFQLEDRSVDVLSLPEHEELMSYYPEAETAVDSDGNLRFFGFELWGSPEQQLNDLICDPLISQIPGLYTVPELGVKNATFKEVLEAVKKYYEAKLSQKPAHTA